MKTVAVIQARTGSSRLPGKVLQDLAGRPMLEQQITRVRLCRRVDEVVIATSEASADDAIAVLAGRLGIRCHRGSEQDVLARVNDAAHEAAADIVVRLTGDCPLSMPEVIDLCVDDYARHTAECDYTSNVMKRTYPRGLDVEVLPLDTLARVARLGQSASSREHVTVFIRSERPDLFQLRNVSDVEDNSALRWVVDDHADLMLMRKLYNVLDLGTNLVTYRQLVAEVKSRPELASDDSVGQTWDPASVNK